MADPAALRDRILALAHPEFELLGLELVEFELLAGGHRFTLRFCLEKAIDPDVDASAGAVTGRAPGLAEQENTAAREAARRVTASECARASRAVARVIEAEEAEHGEFIGRYTIEVSSPGIFRRLTRPEHFERFSGEQIKLSYSEEGRTLQIRGRVVSADASRVIVQTAERGEVEVAFASMRRANLDPDLDFGRKTES